MMRGALRFSLLLLAGGLCGGLSASAQGEAVGAGTGGLQVRKVTPVSRIKTPEYQVSQNSQRGRSREWFRLEFLYDTDAEWMDEATFTCYVLLENKDPKGRPYTLLRNKISYVNIEKGRSHKGEMYVHPSTIARFGDVKAVAVLADVNGRVVSGDAYPPARNKWWEQQQLPPVDGLLLNKAQTPFALIAFDDIEAVKNPVQQ